MATSVIELEQTLENNAVIKVLAVRLAPAPGPESPAVAALRSYFQRRATDQTRGFYAAVAK
jgi:hypothetical protein